MLQTVRYVERNGQQVVVDFDTLLIDPEATKRRALQKASERLHDLQDLNLHSEEIREIHEEYVRDCKENPVHFEPRRNEKIVDNETLQRILYLHNADLKSTVGGRMYNAKPI